MKITEKIYQLIPLKFLPVVLFAAIIHSCSFVSEYEGYSKAGSDMHYRLKVLGEGIENPVPGDYITVDILYSTLADSVFFSGRRKFRLNEPQYKGSVEECFKMMNTGDEADFIINAHKFFLNTLGVNPPDFFKKDDDFRISVNMLDIQTEQSYLKEKEAFLGWIDNFGEYERVKLQQFITEEKLLATPDSSGLYYIPLNNPAGKKIEPGDTLEIHYEGRFLYGRFFDSTRKRDEVFQFVYGQEWQVVEGLEKAIGQMHEGEKALVILPSELAFGEYGSSTGIIPPYTSLVFEVEILSVR